MKFSRNVVCDRTARLVTIGCHAQEKPYINAFADAVAWYSFELGDGLRFGFRYHVTERCATAVRDVLGTLKSVLDRTVPIQVWEGSQEAPLTTSQFRSNGLTRLKQLRSQGSESLPGFAEALLKGVNSSAFRWYRTVSDPKLSGRIDGLEVCKLDRSGRKGIVTIGASGKQGALSTERAVFLDLSGDRKAVHFDETNVDDAIQLIRAIVTERECGRLCDCQPEHGLEARVLRGDLRLSPDGAGTLEPVVATDGLPFQFPTQWTSAGRSKYVDALMRRDAVPWVVELKERTGGQGQYLRHAIPQAVLYRQYVRRAEGLHPWFEERGLVAASCQAAVAFPRIVGKRASQLRSHVIDLARLFGVHVIELDL